MGGGVLDDWELTPSTKSISTVVLLGKAGNGKSATGNSILGREAFASDFCLSGVTSTCELQSTILKDGRTVNVIDTPGLFDFPTSSELVGKEIVNCINLAKDGIHAVLMVFSITSRFTSDEVAAIQSMKSFFGERIVDYMIIIFTGGDFLEAKGMTLNDYINRGCPEPVKNILQLCKNRVMPFNNNTKDKIKQAKQVDQLLSLVDLVVSSNGGKPFSDEIFDELKEGELILKNKEREVEAMEGHSEQQISEMKEHLHKLHAEQMKQITDMIERKLKEAIERLEKQLAEEQAARLEAEQYAKEARKISEEEISKLKEQLEARKRSEEEIGKLREQLKRAQKENQEFRKYAETFKCAIL